jgi:hypothetical protein
MLEGPTRVLRPAHFWEQDESNNAASGGCVGSRALNDDTADWGGWK